MTNRTPEDVAAEQYIEQAHNLLVTWRSGRTGDWLMLENEIANAIQAALRSAEERDATARQVILTKEIVERGLIARAEAAESRIKELEAKVMQYEERDNQGIHSQTGTSRR